MIARDLILKEAGRVSVDRFPNPFPPKFIALFFKGGALDGDAMDDVVATKPASWPASRLKPSQKEIFLGKSLGMAVLGLKGGDLGAVVSSGGDILDGHHRWAATMFGDPAAKISGISVNLKLKELLPVLRAAGDAMGNTRRGAPNGDKNIFSATMDDALAAIYEGENMSPKFYSKENAVAWLENIGGEAVLKKRLEMIQSRKPPSGAPARIHMPVIDAKKGQHTKVANALKRGYIDIRKPHFRQEDEMSRAKAQALISSYLEDSSEREIEGILKGIKVGGRPVRVESDPEEGFAVETTITMVLNALREAGWKVKNERETHGRASSHSAFVSKGSITLDVNGGLGSFTTIERA